MLIKIECYIHMVSRVINIPYVMFRVALKLKLYGSFHKGTGHLMDKLRRKVFARDVLYIRSTENTNQFNLFSKAAIWLNKTYQ